MRKVPVQVSLASGDDLVTRADGVLLEFSMLDRVRRAGVLLLASVLVAAMLIPIPIIHLVGIPLALLTGIVLSVRQLGLAVRLEPVRLACPKCGVVNHLGGGLGRGSVPSPSPWMCESCRRQLTLRIDPAPPAPPG